MKSGRTTHSQQLRARKLRAASILLALAASSTFAAPPAKPATPSASAAKPAEAVKTRAEADKIIDEAGKNQPDWWDDTQLTYPPTLDLTWGPSPDKKWAPQKVMGAYYWDIIDPNPAKWKEGIKLASYCLTNTLKTNPAGQQQAMGKMATIYTEMLGDFARGAYWAKKNGNQLTLAHCYEKLGCPSAAKEILKNMGQDQTRNCQQIKLWAEIGDLKTALTLADLRGKSDPTAAFLAAGDACRRSDKIPEAIAYYQKVLAAPGGGSRDDPINKKRAQANLDAIKLFDGLDLIKIADGTYKGDSIGYVGPIEVEVTVTAHKIEKVEVTKHHEKQFYSSINDTPPRIVAKQGVKGVDTTTGATRTSEAIINASAKALSAAQK